MDSGSSDYTCASCASSTDSLSVCTDETRQCWRFNPTKAYHALLPPVKVFSFPILTAPREIRDLFYTIWLEGEPNVTRTLEQYEDSLWRDGPDGPPWDAAYGENKGFWSPFKRYEQEWYHNWPGRRFKSTDNWIRREDEPVLWRLNRQLREEAMDVHFNRNMLLEMDYNGEDHDHLNNNAMAVFEKWVRGVANGRLAGIRTLRVIVKTTLVARGNLSDKVLATSYHKHKKTECPCRPVRMRGSFYPGDPLFKLELRHGGRTLTILTYCPILDFMDRPLQEELQTWQQSLYPGKRAFDGLDLLQMVRIIKKVEAQVTSEEHPEWYDPDQRACPRLACPPGIKMSDAKYGWVITATEDNTVFIENDIPFKHRKPRQDFDRDGEDPVQRGIYLLKDGRSIPPVLPTSRPKSQAIYFKHRDSALGVKYSHIVAQFSLPEKSVTEHENHTAGDPDHGQFGLENRWKMEDLDAVVEGLRIGPY